MSEAGGAYFKQETEYYCGPAVVQMVLARSDVHATQAEIAAQLETDSVVGTSARELEAYFLRHGFAVAHKTNAQWEDIAQALTAGDGIVGYIEAGEEEPHYALVAEVGESSITLDDPEHGQNFTLNKEEFLKRWKDGKAAQYGERMLMSVTKKSK